MVPQGDKLNVQTLEGSCGRCEEAIAQEPVKRPWELGEESGVRKLWWHGQMGRYVIMWGSVCTWGRTLGADTQEPGAKIGVGEG